jgi:hypothetical protein
LALGDDDLVELGIERDLVSSVMRSAAGDKVSDEGFGSVNIRSRTSELDSVFFGEEKDG